MADRTRPLRDLVNRVRSRLRAMQRLGRKVLPRAPAWGWAMVWFRSSFLPSQNYLILLSVLVGLLTGLASVGFIRMLDLLTHFARTRVASAFSVFGPASVVLLPAIGGLLAGPLIVRFALESRGHGVPEVMTAIAGRGGRIRKAVVMVKVIASALTIGFGGAAGREGPMVQIGAGLGSTLGQFANLTTKNLRTMVACGAAGGIAATFNAPIGGAIFSMEVLMGRFHADFLLVLLTSLSSCMVARHFLGNSPAFVTPAYELASAGELPFYFVLGLLAGLAAVAYVRVLYKSEDFFDGWKFPEWLKPAVGGLLVGLVLRAYPQVYGTGFPAMESALWVRFPWDLMLMLFFAEMAANCATLGSGGSGGIFAPSLYMGAMLGGVYGTGVHALLPDATGGSGPYAMVGMAAFFAAAAKAPTTSILILFEMTNDYRIILPLMAATVGSVSISHRMMPHSIYLLKLHHRGIRFAFYEDPESKPPGGPPRPAPART